MFTVFAYLKIMIKSMANVILTFINLFNTISSEVNQFM